jgi:hypothetical protein
VVIDPGQRLHLGAVGQQEPANDVHLPQLVRPVPLPPFPVPPPPTAVGLHQTGPAQTPIHRRLRHRQARTGLGDLDHHRPIEDGGWEVGTDHGSDDVSVTYIVRCSNDEDGHAYSEDDVPG